jgi:hypothetical protein
MYVNSIYLILVVAALIHTQHHKFDTAGNILDTIFADSIILITFFLPIGFAWFMRRKKGQL